MQDTEIDCTALFASQGFDPWNCSNSVANLGQNASALTWRASRSFAPALVLTPDQLEAFRGLVRASGWGGSREEVNTLPDAELTALCGQWIAGDVREGFGDDLPDDPSEWDWVEYRHMAGNGSVSSTLYLHGGKLFWSCAQ
jgi:hypothetical protein